MAQLMISSRCKKNSIIQSKMRKPKLIMKHVMIVGMLEKKSS